MLGVFVIHPGVDDHFARCVVAEEKAVLLRELGPETVLVIVTEHPTLAELRPGPFKRSVDFLLDESSKVEKLWRAIFNKKQSPGKALG